MAPIPAAVPNSYAFIVDMPGLKSRNIPGQIEENNVLVISGNRKRELEKEDKEGFKYVRMERLMRKFALPKIAKTEKISAVCLDDVLTVKVEKLPPAGIGKPTMIQVQNA